MKPAAKARITGERNNGSKSALCFARRRRRFFLFEFTDGDDKRRDGMASGNDGRDSRDDEQNMGDCSDGGSDADGP